MSRKLKTFVVCSVLLNLLLAGVIVGHTAFRMHPPHGGAGWKPDLSAIETLPADKQDLVRKTLDKVREDGDTLRTQVRNTQEETSRILSAENFDETAYDAQVQKMHELHQQRRQIMADAFKNLAKQLNAEERKVLAEMVRKAPHGKGPDKETPPPAKPLP